MSKSITITGIIHALMETKKVSDKFTKREFVVQVEDGKYPQVLLVQITGDRINQIDGYQVGDSISVDCNLKGREWKSPSGEVKYFVSLEAWKVNGEANQSRGGAHEPAPSRSEADDQIPF